MKRTLALLTIPAALIACWPAAASADPPTATPTVTCEKVTIDPDPGASVTFVGQIGGVAVSLPAHRVGTTNESEADISTFTMSSGPIAWRLTPVWSIPPNPYGVTSGDGPTTEGVLTCHDEPTTTTSSSTSVSTTSTSTTSSPAPSTTEEPSRSTSTTISGITATPSMQIGNATSGELPRTGATADAEAFIGSLFVAGGIMLARGRRRR